MQKVNLFKFFFIMYFMAKRKGNSELEYVKLVCEHCNKELDIPKDVTVYCCNSKMQVKNEYVIPLKAKI